MFGKHNSKFISIVLLFLVGVGGFFLIKQPSKKTADTPKVSSPSYTIVPDGQYCFTTSHKGTELEPYTTEEHVLIYMWDNTMVIGRKMGTQSGPDMNNGYTGLIDGKRSGNDLEVVHSYTIEGSQNKELELYTIYKDKLEKMRYPLFEKDGMLVPDTSGSLTIIPYTPEVCKS